MMKMKLRSQKPIPFNILLIPKIAIENVISVLNPFKIQTCLLKSRIQEKKTFQKLRFRTQPKKSKWTLINSKITDFKIKKKMRSNN